MHVYEHVDMRMYRRLGGEIAVERRPPTGKSVSVSCRACVRAGEAKLRVNLLLLDRSKTESPGAPSGGGKHMGRFE